MLLDQPDAWRRIGGTDAAEVLRDRTLWRMLNPPRVAVVGEPNVGKSTLANRLFGQRVSITADMPGTTRDWVGEFADIDGAAVMLVDTPGRRDAEDAIERAAIEASMEQIAGSDLVLNILDATVRPGDVNRREDILVVINKIDQPAGWDFQPLNAVEISAKTGQGMEKLRGEIHRRLGIARVNESRPRWWTERQRVLIADAIRDSRSLDPRAL
jgi:small GTP-binding protein